MTNVPGELREMWADFYRLFDMYYLIPNTEADWNKYWAAAVSVYNKYGKAANVMKMLTLISEMISDRMKQEELAKERQELEGNGHPHTLEDMNLF